MYLIGRIVGLYQGEIIKSLIIFRELTLLTPNERCNNVSSRNETVDRA